MATKKPSVEENTEIIKEVAEPIIEKVLETKTVGSSIAKKESANLKNTSGKEVKDSDYFFGGVVPSGFIGSCGKPVDREDLLVVFNKVFKPEDNILFYKQTDKEVYLIIIPLKYSTSVSESNNSVIGDFQKHAISFLNEGSVNPDTLKYKLERINSPKFIKYSDR